MPKLTVKDLLELKGVRQIAFVQVTRGEEALAAAAAGMDMIGTGFRAETQHFPGQVPDSHFQFGLIFDLIMRCLIKYSILKAVNLHLGSNKANRVRFQFDWTR
jgi:hypothetical protein